MTSHFVRFQDALLNPIWDKVQAGERLALEDGLALFQTDDMTGLGAMASFVKKRLHGGRVYYSNNLHLNPTNICKVGCHFCAFAKSDPNDPQAYTLTLDQIEDTVRRAVEIHKVREIHIVGGLNDALSFDYHVEMLRRIKSVNNELFIKAFTAVEIQDLAWKAGLPTRDTLMELRRAGLDSMPGGGAEIFHEEIRRKICPTKTTAEEWLDIHREAHALGIHTNATMLYGHIEKPVHRVDHMLRLRELQDETQGLNAFIPLRFHPKNTRLENVKFSDSLTDLKIYAVARLMLDNIPHLKAYWTTLGVEMGQVMLFYGVDDLGGTSVSEKIIHDAGAESPLELSRQELARLITDAGYTPCEVVSDYAKELSY